ncbi:hypothetical protein QBC36DRAFT_364827 [Triangularia setosa]|uniref:Uncharacterized protein n=1 Tax=Triangularia setosa TaxID=2587417 RepID=A0AAN7A8D4_9PEZI|nr:hypothetical protein QBC36DRAFT_364827 [Podospora setosa]
MAPITLPEASTRAASDLVMSRLRAITVCLACFCDKKGVVAILKWAITPEHRRRTRGDYPTRSLRAWAAAAILSQLGFAISVADRAVSTQEDYKSYQAEKLTNVVLLVVANIDGDDTPADAMDSEHDVSV